MEFALLWSVNTRPVPHFTLQEGGPEIALSFQLSP